ncbi:MAG TPA: hypothetical protein VJX67_07265, partial [Blastocatellia bacterium]|nr:hypothetical protein [Blastocatellia bacterium]
MCCDRLKWLAVIIAVGLLAGCGGGGNTATTVSPPSTPAPAPDFSMSVNSPELTVPPGSSGTVTVSVAPINGFTGQVSVSLTGLPSGVTASPFNFDLTEGQGQIVTISAGPQAPYAMTALTFQGTSTSSHNVQVLLAISQVTPTAVHSSIRTRYVRTDASYTYGLQYAPPHLVVYSSQQRRFFVSNPYLNSIDVFDANLEIEIARITVPGAWGLDLSPDGTTIYAGTLVGDIYKVDPVGMKVVQRIPASTIGPNGYTATEAFVLANGSLALLGSPGGLSVDGYQGFAIWNPADNTLVQPGSCVQNIGPFAVNGDRTRVLLSTIDAGGGGEPVCSYDPVAGQFTMGTFPYGTFVRQIIPTPDGQRFYLTTATSGVAVFDAKTVQLLGQISGPSSYALPSGSLGAVLSLDGQTLYLGDALTGVIAGYNTTTFSQTVWVPNFITQNDGLPAPMPSGIDETGLIIGLIGHGVGFEDAAKAISIQPNFVGFGNLSPSTAPVSSSTPVQAPIVSGSFGPANSASVSLAQVYIGTGTASGVSYAYSAPKSFAEFTTPPSTLPGIRDLTALLSDGGLGIAPEAFSYGPSILGLSTNAASAAGGAQGVLFGYGLGQQASDLQVTIGGQQAEVTQLSTAPPITLSGEGYPFPIETALFNVPSGTTGAAVDVTVTTADGSTTLLGALHYTAPVQAYAFRGAPLEEGLYDRLRGVLYFTGQ